MADVPGKFYRATKVRTGVAPSSAGSIEGEVLPPVNPPGSSLNSVGLTMPSAFTVSNSPLTANGTIGVAGAGTVGQYIRGDGSLADFPQTSGGGSSVSYYLNGSVDQGTIGGIAYKELSKVPILGAGTDFTINADGYIASFITDAGDPSLLEIPGGNWNFETYFSASSSGGTPTFYVELYKVSGTTATLIASSSSAPELIAFGTNLTPYFSTLAVPTTTLALTDRLAVRYYVTHSGRTITLHTENNHLCQIVTTFTTGITALNGLTAQVQNFAVGTTGTDFNIASATATHTFNLPTASATNRGALSSADWSLFTQAYNDKINSAAVTGTTTKTLTLTQQDGGTITASWSDLNTDAVLSVFGRTGAVVAANGDYTTAQVTESGNLYYTDARSRAALSFAAGSGAYNTSTGVITIPTNNNQITNGAGYITSAALSGYVQGSASAGQVAYWSSGSAITGESALFWDSTNNRLGIDASSPSSALEVRTASSTLTNNIKFGDATVGYLTAGSSGVFLSSNDGNSRFMFTHTGDVGIGNNGTNGFKFDVTGTGRFTSNLTANSFIKSGGTSSQYLMADGSVSTLSNPVTGTGTTNYLPKFTGASTIGNSNLINDASGNLGLGVTPSAWGSNSFAFQTQGGALWSFSSIYIDVWQNSYFNGSNSIYSTNNAASFYRQTIGEHQWFNAPSGTAGNAITWSQAMTLTSGGNLLVGTNTDNGARLQVSGTATFSSHLTVTSETTSSSLIQQWVYNGQPTAYRLRLNTLVSSGLVRYSFDTTNNFTEYPNNIVIDRGNVGVGTSPNTRFEVTSGNAASAEIQRWSYNDGNAAYSLRLKQDVSAGLVKHVFDVVNNSTTYANNLVLTNGNVGIGTTGGINVVSGWTNFVVNGSTTGLIGVKANEVDYGAMYASTGGNNFVIQAYGSSNAGNMLFLTASTERMRITSGGNVGIGTPSPGNFNNVAFTGPFFDVAGIIQIKGTSSNGVAILQFGGDTFRKATIESSIGTQDPFLAFGTSSSGSSSTNTERMRITSSGNVGIGTPSPLTRLDCQIATTGVLTENAAFRDSSTNGNALQIWNGNNEARLRAVYYGTPSNQSITFWTIRDNGSQGERMRIDHIGNILFKGQSTTTNAEGIFQNLDSRLAFFASNTITVSKDISFFSSLINNEERLRLTSTGNILMAPWLAGNVLIRTSTDTGDTLRVNGNTFSNTIMTWNPENDNRSGVAWRLGAASIGAVTPNRRLRVNVGGVEYYIGAVEV